MTEWLALILLVPAVVVPLVLLFGFAGCGATLADDVLEKVFASLMTGDAKEPNQCLVQRIEPSRLFNSGTVVRITLERPTSGDMVIHRAFISHAADAPGANPYDSAADPTAVPLSQALVIPADPGNGVVELPAVVFTLDAQKPLLLAFDIGSAGFVRFAPAPNTDATAFFGPLWEASERERSAGYRPENRIYLVNRIEVPPEGS